MPWPAGYTVGMFGKYMNRMPKTVPHGFDAFMGEFQATEGSIDVGSGNNGGDYIDPTFDLVANITSDLYPGGMPDGKPFHCKNGYTTSVVGNVSTNWIRKVELA